MLREIKEDLKIWKKQHVHWLEDNIVKMSAVLKLVYRCNAIPSRIATNIFRNWEAYYKIYVYMQTTKDS